MLRNYQAANELNRVSTLSAFNVSVSVHRRKVNQHACKYVFADGSVMVIRSTLGRGDAFHPAWTGSTSDIALGPVQGLPLCINR